MTASPPPPVPPLVKALRDVREMLYRARRKQDWREVEAAIERINHELGDSDAFAIMRRRRKAGA